MINKIQAQGVSQFSKLRLFLNKNDIVCHECDMNVIDPKSRPAGSSFFHRKK